MDELNSPDKMSQMTRMHTYQDRHDSPHKGDSYAISEAFRRPVSKPLEFEGFGKQADLTGCGFGIRKTVYNPSFNSGKFATIKNQAGINGFRHSVKEVKA